GFLSALDVPAERVPADVDQATALYRSLLADRRMLVLLDNAANADQVRPLLPGALGCLALVTSRDRLGGLVARDGALPVTLDVLPPDEARALLAGILGAARVAAEPDAAADLARLCAHLPTGAAPGRYTCHDLLRRYAAERVRADDSTDDREAATRRLYDHYTRTVDAAVDLLKPGVVRLTREPPPSVPFQDRAQALAWVDAERRNLVAAVVAAADQGLLPAAWHLADAMRGYFWLRIALPDWLAVSRAGLAAAEAGGDVPAQAAGQLNLAGALTRQGRMRDAGHHIGRALDLFARA